jgi:hypothetical protein
MNIATQQLIDRIPANHPESPGLRAAVTTASRAAEALAAKWAEIGKNNALSDVGKKAALRDVLAKQFGPALRESRNYLSKARSKLETLKNAIAAKPSSDPSDIAAAILRQEIRNALAEMEPGARAALVSNPKTDQRIIEAVLTAPAIVTGVDGEVLGRVERAWQSQRFAAELQEIDSLEKMLEAAQAGVDLARGDAQRETSRAGTSEALFESILRPIEATQPPWLLKSGPDIMVVEVGPDQLANYRVATETELRIGHYYANEAEWRQAQAA